MHLVERSLVAAARRPPRLTRPLVLIAGSGDAETPDLT
jgi:hypothetical protein